MDQKQIEAEEAFFTLIDLFNQELNKDKEFSLKYRSNNPDSGFNKEPFITFFKKFEPKFDRSEIFDFLYSLGKLRSSKTFYDSNEAKCLIKDFEKLGFKIPHFVLKCQEEIVQREQYIKSFFEREEFKWSQSEKEEFLLKVQKEAKIHSFDASGERDFLKKKFEKSIKEVKKIESGIEKHFGYLLNGFFDGETFTATQSDLNNYFYHSELASGGWNFFIEVFQAFHKFIKKKNEVIAIRSYLSGPQNQDSPESEVIKNIFNSMPIEQVRDHFKPLIEKENPKKLIWMTNEDFDIFLRRSFGKDGTLEKPKINLGHGAKLALAKLFYQFYEKCQIEDYNQNRNKEPFLNLLKDAFLTEEFQKFETSNFKASKSKYEWN